jgi:signal transduction histidine kinase
MQSTDQEGKWLFLLTACLWAGSVALLYRVGGVALSSTQRLAAQRDNIESLHQVLSTLKDAEAGQRGYLLTGEDPYLRPYREALQRLPHELDHLRILTARGNLPDREVRQLLETTARKLSDLEQAIEVRRDQGLSEALKIVLSGKGKQLMDEIRMALASIERSEEKDYQRVLRRGLQATYFRTASFLVLGVLNLGFLWWAYGRLERERRQKEKAVLQRLAQEERANAQLKEAAQAIRETEELRRSAQRIRELNEQSAQRLKDLALANDEMEAFSYSVSHDLRAPLRQIAGFTRLVEESAAARTEDQSKEYFGLIQRAVQRMTQLIDDLLVFSRTGRAELKRKEVNFQDLVEQVRQTLQGTLEGRTVHWQIHRLPMVHGDASLLRQVMVNLLENALKFTRSCPTAEIEIGSHSTPAEHTFFVRDNGAGYDPQYAAKLFGVFQRLHRAGEFEGTGIGLATVRRIIQRHGGRTWAEGAVGQGATIYFSLPAADAAGAESSS